MQDDNKSIKIEVDISFEEVYKQNKYQLYSSTLANVIELVIVLSFLLAFIVLYIIKKEGLFQLILWSLFIALQPLSVYLGSKRVHKRLKGAKIYTLSDYGVVCEIDSATVLFRYKWKDIRKVLESGEAFIFFPSYSEAEGYFIIPKRCFKDEEEIAYLKELLEKNIKRSRLKFATKALNE